MGNVRGLRTRLCPECAEITPHRTLYVRAAEGGKRRWIQAFWACTRCRSLNHIVLPEYRLERVASPLPTPLAMAIVKALVEGPLDLAGLIVKVRKEHPEEVHHVFNSEVILALDFLRGHGVVTKESRDCTEAVLNTLRERPGGSDHLGVCPVEGKRSLVSLYAQTLTGHLPGSLVPAGVFCLYCHYRRTDF
jgi:hypothetical protein